MRKCVEGMHHLGIHMLLNNPELELELNASENNIEYD